MRSFAPIIKEDKAEVQSTVTGNPYNAVNLSLGKGACFNDNDEVTLVKAQLVVS